MTLVAWGLTRAVRELGVFIFSDYEASPWFGNQEPITVGVCGKRFSKTCTLLLTDSRKHFVPSSERTRCCHIFQIIDRIFKCVVDIMTTARRNYYINWCCNRLWILRFAGWLVEPEGKVNITQGNIRLVFTKFCRQVVWQVVNNNSTVKLFQYVLRYCSLHAFIQLCQSVHIHNKQFTYWFNVLHPKLGDEWLLTVWLLAQPRISSDTFNSSR